jgi:hypothetical protein
MKHRLKYMALLILWVSLVSFNPYGENTLPVKKIGKAIKKIWKVEEYQLLDDLPDNSNLCVDKGCWLKVVSGNKNLGMIYIGRVNSCRSGGCSIDPEDDEALSFEFFDYFLLSNMNGEVLWVKVFNYQATQGHEVMSRGWLNQFKGLKPGTQITLGNEIDGISGATVSASAITGDIQDILSCAWNH